MSLARLCLLALPFLVGCSVDIGRLRAPIQGDGASDLALPLGGAGGGSVDAAAVSDKPGSADVPTVDHGGQANGGSDGAASVGVDAAIDELASGGRGGGVDSAGGGGGGAAGGGAGTGENGGAGGSAGAGGSGGTEADGGTGAATDAPGAASAEAGADRQLDGALAASDSGALDSAPDSAGTPQDGAADLAPDTRETGGSDRPDSPAASDTPRRDAPPGTVTCPATINGTLNQTDHTQIGRLDRWGTASACGSSKAYPNSAADPNGRHLYDVYHFFNTSSVPVCFNFTLAYPGDPLFAAAYTSFQPTDIASGYLGDVGAQSTSPQTMGITVDAGDTIDVVVYAVAEGTAPAGSYTLSCRSP